jgi:ParE toxin of type II toxin-antitoxin system, parDE
MNYVLVFRLEARNELEKAYSWYESQQPGLGDDFLEQAEAALDRTCQMPESYPVVYRDVRRSIVRRF